MVERKRKRFLLISILPQQFTDHEVLKDLLEVKDLIESYGGELVELITQRREIHDKGSYIGEGKIQEAGSFIQQKDIDIVVLNALVKPGQIYDMKSTFRKRGCEVDVWDRIDLILHIFSKHARTKEARLQIELAAMRHMGPRIYGMGMELSRQRGGIGTRGIGETNTELMKRHWHVQMKATEEKLKKLAIERRRQLIRRKRIGIKTASLVGYTNAGKTSLFNALTKKNKLVLDALFVTLDSFVGKVYLPDTHTEILVSDTIGFIKNLPTQLIDAFQSTLLESLYADILLHVIDASDEDMLTKIAVVEGVLSSLGLSNKRKIYVFNKVDIANGVNKIMLQKQFFDFPSVFISVQSGEGIDALISKVEYELAHIYSETSVY